ncbi:MAG: hypothetical protein K2K68_02985, partial [Duncaniella sp.]|nr:hypothetical protein [Duncaniella sp.]
NDPNPTTHFETADEYKKEAHYADPAKIWERLTYKTSGKLLDHEIYKLNIGAPRWRSSDPKTFRIPTPTDSKLEAPAE